MSYYSTDSQEHKENTGESGPIQDDITYEDIHGYDMPDDEYYLTENELEDGDDSLNEFNAYLDENWDNIPMVRT